MELGIMIRESRGSGAGVRVTVTEAAADTTVPSALLVNSAVIVLVPALKPVTSPDEFTLAMVGMLELHVICCDPVTFSWRPELPKVARAMNCPVWPDADSDCAPGTIATAVNCSVVPPTMVKVAVPVATVLSGFVTIAVTVVVPCPTPVASPPEVMVATVVLLELHVT
jgi:hypothetical protein